jgi:hypothetical protein
MKDIETLKIAMMKGVKQFFLDYPLTPPNVKATAHAAEVDDVLAQCAEHGGSQDLGNGTLLGTTVEKAMAAEALRKQMRKLAKTAKILDKAIYPTMAEEMRLSGADSYAQLLERGRAFVAALTGNTAVFIEYGAAATVLTDLQAAVAALEAAIGHKASAFLSRVGSTAGLDAVTRAGVLAVRKLDAIVSAVHENDPVLLAAWKSAQRIHSLRSAGLDEEEPETAPEPPVTPPAGS